MVSIQTLNRNRVENDAVEYGHSVETHLSVIVWSIEEFIHVGYVDILMHQV